MMVLHLLWFCLLKGGNADTTFISFSRRVDTCDPMDRPLQETTSRVIWSYNSQDPESDTQIVQHEERGLKSIRFFSEDATPVFPNNTLPMDIAPQNTHVLFNDPQLGATTQYWCTAYKIAGAFTEKRQIIRAEPIIDPRNTKNVHHFLLYQCPYLNDTDLAYQGGCSDPNVPPTLKQCHSVQLVAAWAVGGFPQNYPDYLGLPIMGDVDGDVYFVLETHYDNPYSLDITDSSGFRLWYTSTLRPTDAGILLYSLNQFSLPPGQIAYGLDGWCPETCTEAMYPSTGINLVAITLHSHLAGRQMFLHHIRNGTELPPIIVDPYYDFNYQEFSTLLEPRNILPGDIVKARCVWDTTDRTTNTPWGRSTHQEMCSFYAVYYPKLPAASLETCGEKLSGTNNQNGIVSCANISISNYNPPPYVPYVAPPCIYSPPPVNVTAPILVDALNTSAYYNSAILDDKGKYKLYWTLDHENLLFHGAIEVENPGWVGFGISPNGMEGADVFIGWVKDGQVHFADRFAYYKALPAVDQLQDFYNIQGGQIVSTSSPSLSQNAIIGIAVGGCVAVVFLIIAIFYCLRARKKLEAEKYQALGDKYGGTQNTTTPKNEPVPL